MDVYIIPDVQPLYKKKRALLRKPEQKFDWKDLGKSLLLTLAATGISFLFYELGLREANIIIVYLLGGSAHSGLDERVFLRGFGFTTKRSLL